MVEVFKTNVTDRRDASMLVNVIRSRFTDYFPNFDLEDCDRILRIKSRTGCIQSSTVIHLLEQFGYCAEVLTEDDGLSVFQGIYNRVKP